MDYKCVLDFRKMLYGSVTYLLTEVCLLFILQLPPAATAGLSMDLHQPVVIESIVHQSFPSFLSSSFALHAPPNPSAPTFAGWLPSNGAPAGAVTQPVSLQQLSANYQVSLDDHCYANNKPVSRKSYTLHD